MFHGKLIKMSAPRAGERALGEGEQHAEGAVATVGGQRDRVAPWRNKSRPPSDGWATPRTTRS